MNHRRSQPLIRQARRWRIALGMSAGALAAAAMLGLSEAADAHADDSADVLGQAGMDLTQATSVLDGAPEASLNAEELSFLTGQESLQTDELSTLLAEQESLQSGLPAADQSDLSAADTQLTDAFQGMLTADQTFATADQAGDLSGFTGLSDQLGVIDADFGLLGADANTVVADIGAEFANFFDLSALMP
ncbi:MAG TPA: hypothetical protein VN871_01235 [Mycobacterium sp.]|nr:hypothetical protein [Mycobacterium sp.]